MKDVAEGYEFAIARMRAIVQAMCPEGIEVAARFNRSEKGDPENPLAEICLWVATTSGKIVRSTFDIGLEATFNVGLELKHSKHVRPEFDYALRRLHEVVKEQGYECCTLEDYANLVYPCTGVG